MAKLHVAAHRPIGAAVIGIAAMIAIAAACPAWACTITSPAPFAGETDAAFHARIQAEEAASQTYANASERERAAIDQARWWEGNPMIFMARVEKVRVAGRVYGIPKPQAAGPRYVMRRGRRIKAPPLPPEPPVPVTLDYHQAFLRPVAWIKGEPQFAASWQDVGGSNSCGSMSDGDLGFADPGDHIIVFAQPFLQYDRARRTMVESKSFSLIGIEPADAADPRLTKALREFEALKERGAAR